MAKTTTCLSSLHGIQIDTLLSAEDIKSYLDHSEFQELADMVTDGSHFTLWSILVQMKRRGVRTEILNKIIEGVRSSPKSSMAALQDKIDKAQQGAQEAEENVYPAAKQKLNTSTLVRKMRAEGKTDKDIAFYMLKNGYKKVEVAKALYPGHCTRSNYYKHLYKLIK